MRCIFCLLSKEPSLEHIFPLAIGGMLTTDRVCRSCNSQLGDGADAGLTNHLLVRVRRAQLGLAGNSGTVPDVIGEMFRRGELVDNPGVKVRTVMDPTTGRLDPKILRSVVTNSEGVQEAIIDARDAEQIGVRAQRAREKAGLPPLTANEIEAVVAAARAQAQPLGQPWIRHSFQVSLDSFVPGIAKIAYELAFLWFGEPYLDDPDAGDLRTAILANDLAAAPVEVNMDPWPTLCFWKDEPTSHLAHAVVSGARLYITVRIFDVLAIALVVSRSASAYVSNDPDDIRLRFLALDPVGKAIRDTSLCAEEARLSGTSPGV